MIFKFDNSYNNYRDAQDAAKNNTSILISYPDSNFVDGKGVQLVPAEVFNNIERDDIFIIKSYYGQPNKTYINIAIPISAQIKQEWCWHAFSQKPWHENQSYTNATYLGEFIEHACEYNKPIFYSDGEKISNYYNDNQLKNYTINSNGEVDERYDIGPKVNGPGRYGTSTFFNTMDRRTGVTIPLSSLTQLKDIIDNDSSAKLKAKTNPTTLTFNTLKFELNQESSQSAGRPICNQGVNISSYWME